jgi:hypothetical protein
MATSICFDRKQRFWVGDALGTAEDLAENYFRVDLKDCDRFPYDLQTLIHLKREEKTTRALAQVCKYEYQKGSRFQGVRRKSFYRICLQDDKILESAKMEKSALLKPLLLYVVAHELIHVIRFSMDPGRFHLSLPDKKIEEKNVHRLTYELLRPMGDPKIEMLLERYRPLGI